ncbi:MAG: hypothetical protein ACN6OS_11065 [Comamonas testosteroni]|uniref:hypothetical protein n=1 Tax=Comamonas testosteroni TaxID=285 RepID=UPI003D09BAFD
MNIRKNDEQLAMPLAAAKAATDLAEGQKLSVTNFSFCAGELHYDRRENCHYIPSEPIERHRVEEQDAWALAAQAPGRHRQC